MERLQRILIQPTTTIRQALKLMDASGSRIIIVTGLRQVLLGVATDGDIRRWILKNGPLTEHVDKIMNKSPIVLRDGYAIETAKALMIEKNIECIPVLNERKEVVSAIWWQDLFEKKKEKREKLNLPVVVMAGGEGSRLAPFTKILPKPLVPIGDRTILEHILDRFYDYSCRDIYLSLNYKSNLIKAYFNDIDHKYTIHYLHEDKPLGTAGALHMLSGKIKKRFFVSNCDILIDADFADILKYHLDHKNKITIVGSVKHFMIPYGVCDTGDKGALKKIDEKPEYDYLVNTGMYLLEPEVLKLIPKNCLYHLTDLIANCLKRKQRVGVYPISEKSWLDIGQFEELKETLKRFGV